MIEGVNANINGSTTQAKPLAKKPEVQDNKFSTDYVKKHAAEFAIGAAALAAVVAGGIYYARRGKGAEDVKANLGKAKEALDSEAEQVEELLTEANTELKGSIKELQSQVEKSRKTLDNLNNDKGSPEVKLPTEPVKPKIDGSLSIKPGLMSPDDLYKSAPDFEQEIARARQSFEDLPKEWLKVPDEFDWAKLGGKEKNSFVDITDENGQLIKRLFSIDKKTLSSIDYYAEDGAMSYTQWFSKGKLAYIDNSKTNERIFLCDDGSLDSVHRYKTANFKEPLDDTYFSRFSDNVSYTKYDSKAGEDVLVYKFDTNKKYINTIEQVSPTNNNLHQIVDFNPDGTVKRIII